jgi:hypothetical protein
MCSVTGETEKEKAMMLRALVEKEVYIRLADDETAIVCTVRYGRLRTKVAKFPVELTSCVTAEETERDPVRIRKRFPNAR